MNTTAGLPSSLRLVDRVFRVAGSVAVVALAATIAMALARAEAWRVPFVVAHLAALIELTPLGVALVLHAYEESGGVAPMLTRHALVSVALAVIAVGVMVTLLAFSENREVRRISNFVTVGVVLLLVVRYLRWSRR